MFSPINDIGYGDTNAPVRRNLERKVSVKINGERAFFKHLTFQKNEINKLAALKKLIQKALYIQINDYNTLRIYNNDGCELFEEDFEF